MPRCAYPGCSNAASYRCHKCEKVYCVAHNTTSTLITSQINTCDVCRGRQAAKERTSSNISAIFWLVIICAGAGIGAYMANLSYPGSFQTLAGGAVAGAIGLPVALSLLGAVLRG
jgi:DNA-directed RNA polymerase subunit RPC12/RpoP